MDDAAADSLVTALIDAQELCRWSTKMQQIFSNWKQVTDQSQSSWDKVYDYNEGTTTPSNDPNLHNFFSE